MTTGDSAHARKVTLVGAGLVGSLLATLLAQRGFDVEVFERRPDPRVHGFLGGRSINLALVERGLRPLRMAGLAKHVRASAVMMRGRMVHPLDGEPNLQPYGINDAEVDYSVSRGGLNMLLLDAAERAGARLHFERAFVAANFDAGEITLGAPDGAQATHAATRLIGCDGAGSAVRAAMAQHAALGERSVPPATTRVSRAAALRRRMPIRSRQRLHGRARDSASSRERPVPACPTAR